MCVCFVKQFAGAAAAHFQAAAMFQSIAAGHIAPQLRAGITLMYEDHLVRGKMCALKSSHTTHAIAQVVERSTSTNTSTNTSTSQEVCHDNVKQQILDAVSTSLVAVEKQVDAAQENLKKRMLEAMSSPLITGTTSTTGTTGTTDAGNGKDDVSLPSPSTSRLLATIQLLRDENEALVNEQGLRARLSRDRQAFDACRTNLQQEWLKTLEGIRGTIAAMVTAHTKIVAACVAQVHTRLQKRLLSTDEDVCALSLLTPPPVLSNISQNAVHQTILSFGAELGALRAKVVANAVDAVDQKRPHAARCRPRYNNMCV